jgi:hypothetical protein
MMSPDRAARIGAGCRDMSLHEALGETARRLTRIS